ncbi:MAG: hypothetical protein JRJ20_04985 [Deltaproteobacteria bacterium]|nr:hypothetical protein [Deltaproteobacteria bacterium]
MYMKRIAKKQYEYKIVLDFGEIIGKVPMTKEKARRILGMEDIDEFYPDYDPITGDKGESVSN